MRVLMLSWRCPANPRAGGAEVVTEHALRHLAASGHEVTWFTASYPGALAEEVRHGIRHVRRGRQWTVHLQAWRWLRGRMHSYDRIVDQINTIPFGTPLYVDAARRRFIFHQLAREYWWRETRGLFRLLAPLGYLAEPVYLRAYRSTRGMTISESSRSDLARLGISPENVVVVPIAATCPVVDRPGVREGPFTVVMVSRLTPAKYIEEGICAFARVRDAVPEARLWIVGSGDDRYRRRLEALVAQLGLAGAVTFHGRVDTALRQELFAAAHVHLFASHREGWGLVVSEAAAAGTPTVAYDAPGVRDSIPDRTLLAPIGDVAALAERVVALWRDTERHAAASDAARRRAAQATPEAMAVAIATALS